MSKDIDLSWLKIDGKPVQDEKGFCDWVNNWVTDHPVVKLHHGKWIEMMAWEDGDQFSIWNESAGRVVAVDLVTRKKRLVYNLIKPLVETLDGKINFVHSIIGQPNSGENKDVYGAMVATKLIAYNDTVSNHEEAMEEMKYDMLRTGTGCIRWFYDESIDAKHRVMKKGKNAGFDIISTKGDLNCYAPNIFNLRPDPRAKRPEDMLWHIEIKEVSVETALDAYGDRVDRKWLEEAATGQGQSKKYLGMNEDPQEKSKDTPTLILKEFIEKPTEDYPKGRFIVTCEDRVLWADINPNAGFELGYYYYYYRKNKKSFWGRGPIFFVQDLQRELNRMVSIEAEHHESWKPKLAVPLGGLARMNSMTTDFAEIVELSFNGGKPEPIIMPPMNGQIPAFREFLIAGVDRVSNVHEVSYSRLPQYASRAPASLYQMMLEQESVKLDPMIKRTNKTIRDEARFRLRMMDKYYTEERMIKIMGPNRMSSVRYFSKVDLNENFDVQLEIGVSLNQSPTIQQRMILELWDKKIFEGRDRIKILKLLNLGTVEQDLRNDVADSERATRENQMFMDGTYLGEPGKRRPVFVYLHDDHELHLESHTALMKSEEVETWEDEVVEALQKHIDEHYAYFLQLSQAAAEQASTGTQGSGEMSPGAGSTSEEGLTSPEDERAQEEAERAGVAPEVAP